MLNFDKKTDRAFERSDVICFANAQVKPEGSGVTFNKHKNFHC